MVFLGVAAGRGTRIPGACRQPQKSYYLISFAVRPMSCERGIIAAWSFMAKGKRRKSQTRERWLWMIVAVLILWGGYQIWQVRRQIVGQLHRQRRTDDRTADAKTNKAGNASPQINLSTSPQSPAEITFPAPQPRRPITPAELRAAQQLLKQGIHLADEHHLISARFRLERAWHIVARHQTQIARSIRKWLSKINIHTLLSGVAYAHDPWIRLIKVPPGDTLERIAHLYRITPAMLLTLNPLLNPRDMRAGSWLLVILGPFNARFDLTHQRVDILIHHQFVLSYHVKIAGVINPRRGDYSVVRSSLSAPVQGMPEFIGMTLVGWINGRQETVKISNIDSPDIDLVMTTQSLAELVRMLNPTFSVVRIRL